MGKSWTGAGAEEPGASSTPSGMKELFANLLRLQAIDFDEITEREAGMTNLELRQKIPAPILGHYDRLVARGKRGVAIVRNQVCSGCHMQIPMGTITVIMRGEDIQVCENCGRYLFLPDETDAELVHRLAEAKAARDAKAAGKQGARKRKTLAHAA
jgi:hypothetical protein